MKCGMLIDGLQDRLKDFFALWQRRLQIYSSTTFTVASNPRRPESANVVSEATMISICKRTRGWQTYAKAAATNILPG
jgi:hypothetical protein